MPDARRGEHRAADRGGSGTHSNGSDAERDVFRGDDRVAPVGRNGAIADKADAVTAG